MTRILLVEDNEMNRDMLSRRLERKGYEVIFAVDGEEAVARAVSDAPDLILMDIGLPGIDGCEATRLIRENPVNVGLPIIALTAHALAIDETRARDAGCSDFDTKPIDLPRLLGKIEALLSRSDNQ